MFEYNLNWPDHRLDYSSTKGTQKKLGHQTLSSKETFANLIFDFQIKLVLRVILNNKILSSPPHFKGTIINLDFPHLPEKIFL